MQGTALQYLVGGLAFVLMVWLKGADFVRILSPPLPEQVARWLRRVVQAVMVFVATACFLDPFIPGTADLTIHAPGSIPMTLDTLTVEAVPVGFLGEAGADRTRYESFDARGISQVTVKLGFLETRVKLRVFDRTAPSRSVISESRYVSPFVRRRFCASVVRF